MKLNTTLTYESMKHYLEDVKTDPDFPKLNDHEIIEEYMYCHLDCLYDEYRNRFDSESFIRSCDTVLTLMFRDESLTKRVIDELKELNVSYIKQIEEQS